MYLICIFIKAQRNPAKASRKKKKKKKVSLAFHPACDSSGNISLPPAKSDGMKIHLKRGEIYRGKGPRAAPAKHSGKVCGHVQGSTGRGASPRAHGALGIAAFAPCWGPQSHLRSSGTLGTEPRGQPGLHKSTLEPGGKTRDLLLATCLSSTGYQGFCKNLVSPLCHTRTIALRLASQKTLHGHSWGPQPPGTTASVSPQGAAGATKPCCARAPGWLQTPRAVSELLPARRGIWQGGCEGARRRPGG